MNKKIPKVNTRYILIKNSKVHGKGVFAKTDIRKDTKIIEYVGELISKKEGDRRSEIHYKEHKKDKNRGAVYIYDLNKKYDLDGNFKWNPARLINHSCSPNSKYKIIKNKVWIIAKKPIKKGEEINYNYGYDDEDFKDHPCKCNSKNCIGYIVGPRYKKSLLKKLKKAKNKYNH